MTNLFTIYEAVQPPAVISPETLQNYEEIIDFGKDLQSYDLNEESVIKDNIIKEDDLKAPNIAKKNIVKSVVDIARQYIGSNYKWSGNNPNTGFDCSGLMQYVFKQVGINLPRTAMQLGKVGQKVELALPGDVIWFGSKNSPSGLHIGLVSKIENGQIYIIDAAGKNLGVTERVLPNLPIKSIRRITKGESFANTVLDYFKNKGLSESQSRGILGNLMLESRGDHTIINKTSGAFGIAQWIGPRKLKLILKYGTTPTVLDQLDFIWEELNTTEKETLLKLINTKTIADATRVFANNFERAGKNEMNMNRRISYAYNI